MEITYKSKNSQYEIKLSSETETGLIQQLVDFQNLLEKNNVCGACNSEDVFWNIRGNDDGQYYEKKCNKCYAAMPYHVNKDKVKKGGLYYSWKDKWTKYDPNAPKSAKDEEVFNEKAPAKKGK